MIKDAESLCIYCIHEPDLGPPDASRKHKKTTFVGDVEWLQSLLVVAVRLGKLEMYVRQSGLF